MIHVGQPDLTGNERAYVMQCLAANQLTMGPMVERFEDCFADWLGVDFALACNSGTSALHLALLALGIGPGDAVIVPTLSFVATANAVRYTGAEVIFADVSRYTWCMTAQDVTKAWQQDNVKAIIPVHLYGWPVDVKPLREFGLPIIEDAAEGLGAAVNGKKAGTLGELACFSFYGNKTITTGEGGMVVANTPELSRQIGLYRGQGQGNRRYWHEVTGYNYRMTDTAAAIGVAQMERLDSFLQRRAEIAALYRELIPGVTWQTGGDDLVNGNWAAACLLPGGMDRDGVRQRLADVGIETRPAFYPIHTMPMYKNSMELPNAEAIAQRGIVLPMHTGLTNDDVSLICLAVRREVNKVAVYA